MLLSLLFSYTSRIKTISRKWNNYLWMMLQYNPSDRGRPLPLLAAQHAPWQPDRRTILWPMRRKFGLFDQKWQKISRRWTNSRQHFTYIIAGTKTIYCGLLANFLSPTLILSQYHLEFVLSRNWPWFHRRISL